MEEKYGTLDSTFYISSHLPFPFLINTQSILALVPSGSSCIWRISVSILFLLYVFPENEDAHRSFIVAPWSMTPFYSPEVKVS